jgi:hypothetical protein
MNRYVWLAVGAFLMAAVLIAVQRGNKDFREFQKLQLRKAQSDPQSVKAGRMTAPRTKVPPTVADLADGVVSRDSEEIDPQFRQWLASEAKNLDAPHVDGRRKQNELQAIAQKLTPVQSRQLLVMARDPRASAGEKILSTYLLIEGGSLSREELAEFITSPLDDHGPHPAHSEAEMAGVRDKSLRIMALDGLFGRAETDPSVRETLAKVIADIQDPYVRGYARDRFTRLKAQ